MSETERPSSLRLWLARYKPDRVRCTLRGGEQRELPKPSTTRGQWSQMEHGIVALAPTYLEAFQGETCVASRTLEGEEESEAAPAAPPADPMTAFVQALPTITQLIVDAADASAMRHQDAYKMAFDSQLQLVKILSDRLGGLERAWHKMILDRAAEAQGGGENDGAAMSLIGSIIKDRAMPNGHANGASASAKPDVDVTDD